MTPAALPETCPRCGNPVVPHPSGRCMHGWQTGYPCNAVLVPPAPKVKKPRRQVSGVLERDVLRKVIGWLELQYDCTVERINVVRFGPDGVRRYASAEKGSADVHATVRGPDGFGRALYVETKKPGEKQRPEQVEYQREREAKGCVYVVEDSLDLERTKAAVEYLRTATRRAG